MKVTNLFHSSTEHLQSFVRVYFVACTWRVTLFVVVAYSRRGWVMYEYLPHPPALYPTIALPNTARRPLAGGNLLRWYKTNTAMAGNGIGTSE